MTAQKKKGKKGQAQPRMLIDRSKVVTDIFRAAAADDADAISAALADNVDVNSQDDDDMTPLHYAAANLAHRAVDRLLLELNSPDPIDPTITDRFGRTASAVAVEVHGSAGAEMARKLRPYCDPSNE